MTPAQLGQTLSVAHNSHDWEQVLRLLRKGPQLVSPDKIAYIRARAYEELGHLETSLLFMEFAAKINPNNENYEYFVVERLQRLNRSAEALEYAERQMNSGHRSAGFRIQYADILYMSARNLDLSQAMPVMTLSVQ